MVARLRVMVLVAGLVVAGCAPPAGLGGNPGAGAGGARGCSLQSAGGRIQHVIAVAFDNVHFTRDDPNVPSDLEQMPHLLDFISRNGTLLTNEHTPLIAHTGTDLLSSFTGLYGDQMGQPASNTFDFYDSGSTASTRPSFTYWTTRLGGKSDDSYNMVTAGGRNTPAPWVPFTRAGCSVGAVAAANMVLENATSDIPAAFGPGSGAASDPHPQTDLLGIAVHCGRSDRRCAGAAGARPDVLPDEPGGYQGFSALYGARNVDRLIGPSGPVTGLDGKVIGDPKGISGFPGFDSMSANASLGYVAAMQEHGVPVTYAYVSDVHDNHGSGTAFGPGEAGYVQALRSYDQAFGRFFDRLQRDGITRDNTLFVLTADEGDHFVGGAPSPAGCNGVSTTCTYQQIGTFDANLPGLLGSVPPFSTGAPVPAMAVRADSAPTVYLDGDPGQTDPVTRSVERAAKELQGTSPITYQSEPVTAYEAGSAEMRDLHMLSSDRRRDPTFTLFANPDYLLCAGAGSRCPEQGTQVDERADFAWNHGDVSSEIDTTWLGLVGPGVRPLGVDGSVWSSHADDRPTMLSLVGLKDDYRHQGRILVEALDPGALPGPLRGAGDYVPLAQMYEQLNSPVGQFGADTLRASTTALQSGTSQDDHAYAAATRELEDLGTQRDQVAGRMADALDGAVSTAGSGGLDDRALRGLEGQGQSLLRQADSRSPIYAVRRPSTPGDRQST